MNIDRNNYEQWFIDYLDGTLGKKSRQELKLFLKANPDLAKELESLGETSLEPEHVPFSAKTSLLMENAEDGCPHRSDYLMIKQMEEGLDDREEKELAALIDSDESLLERVNLYHRTRLKAPAASFPGKEKLLRKDVAPLFFRKFYRWSSVAAAALLLLYLGWSRMDKSSDGRANWSATRLEAREFPGFEVPEVPVVLAEVDHISVEPEKSAVLSLQKEATLPDAGKVRSPGMGEAPKFVATEMTPLKKRAFSKNLLHVEHPNAYEAGLRHMMPLYLELNRDKQMLLAKEEKEESSPENKSLIVRGMQFMDKLGGDLVHFDKIYDEKGNYVAFNFKTGVFEMERKIKR
ncbi:MAG: hypothetical protein ACQEQ0_04255 [Bacteroidota bacterium]